MEHWPLAAGGRRCKGCRHRIALLAGTPFHRARVPAPAVLEAAWLMTEPNSVANASSLTRNAAINRENAWTVMHKFREVMHRDMCSVQLRGIVEVDEVFVGGKPRKRGTAQRGRGTAKYSVVVLAERRKGERVIVRRVRNIRATTLLAVVRSHVAPGATIRIDANPSYGGLAAMGYRHTSYNMSALPLPAHRYLLVVHAVSSNAKRWLTQALHRTPSGKHLDYYLAEFAFRCNRRTARQRGLSFYRLLEATLQ
nr:IS1595 family transposase [Conexibacter sp. S30A1]